MGVIRVGEIDHLLVVAVHGMGGEVRGTGGSRVEGLLARLHSVVRATANDTSEVTVARGIDN